MCRKLANEGLLTLGQVLDCYPSRLITSQPGRLPDVEDVDPVVTLAVRLMNKPVSSAAAAVVWWWWWQGERLGTCSGFIRGSLSFIFLPPCLRQCHPAETRDNGVQELCNGRF